MAKSQSDFFTETQQTTNHTPMIKQFLRVKAEHPDKIVFYRMGDFFETFFSDAEKVSNILDIVLTQRGNSNGDPVKMAGIPHHALEQYLVKLMRSGESVVICDQVGEVPAKGLVERKVTRILTPGTVTDASLIDNKRDNLVLSVFGIAKNKTDTVFGLAWINLSSGSFKVCEVENENQLTATFERLQPAEVLLADTQYDYFHKLFSAENRTVKSFKKLPIWHFETEHSSRVLCEHFRVMNLASFGIEHLTAGLVSSGALLEYVKYTQGGLVPHILSILLERIDHYVYLDAPTRRNLELTETLSGASSPTLFSLMDQTATSMGSRRLRFILHHPWRDQTIIQSRLNAIQLLITKAQRYIDIHNQLRSCADIERISARIALKNARPRDLSQLRDTLIDLPKLRQFLYDLDDPVWRNLDDQLDAPPELIFLLQSAIHAEPSSLIREGNVIADGYDAELDELRAIQNNCDDFLRQLENAERLNTNIASLKVEYNKVHGFYIEVPRQYADAVPMTYQRRQTLKNVERYITPELKAFEDKALSAQERALAREKWLYESILEKLSPFVIPLQQLAQIVMDIDVLANFAERAENLNYCKPQLVQNECLEIKKGRHPVVEQRISPFIPNDCLLNTNRKMLLITGPNMGGKSTYMRQIAQIVLLAYCGCFVPAEFAQIGLIDQIFTRIGASDDLASGRSTFMVEMTEMANILNYATSNSLVLVDEIGRGTSTYDGLALAYACAHYLVEKNQSWTLFSTHYFELTQLSDELSQIANVHVEAIEYDHQIKFLHEVREGAADKSYGLHVAGLAGIPEYALKIARQKQEDLQQNYKS